MIVARHCAGVSRHVCPSASATPTPIRPEIRYRADKAIKGDASATIIRADVKAEDHMTAKASPMRIARISMRGPFRFSSGRRLPQLPDRGKRIQRNADLRQTQRAARGRPFVRTDCDQSYSLTLSFSAFAMVILTTLSASFLNCSPVAGLRTIRSGRSRQ